jgi:hypothetical protein
LPIYVEVRRRQDTSIAFLYWKDFIQCFFFVFCRRTPRRKLVFSSSDDETDDSPQSISSGINHFVIFKLKIKNLLFQCIFTDRNIIRIFKMNSKCSFSFYWLNPMVSFTWTAIDFVLLHLWLTIQWHSSVECAFDRWHFFFQKFSSLLSFKCNDLTLIFFRSLSCNYRQVSTFMSRIFPPLR